jgi:hypothetical protein
MPALRSAFVRSSRVVALVTFPAMTGLAVLAEPAVHVVFGSQVVEHDTRHLAAGTNCGRNGSDVLSVWGRHGMSDLRPFRAVLPELDARDCGCDGKGRRVITVDYACAPFPALTIRLIPTAPQTALSIVVGCPTSGRTRKKGSFRLLIRGFPCRSHQISDHGSAASSEVKVALTLGGHGR